MKNAFTLILIILISFCSNSVAQETKSDLQTSDVTLNYSETIVLYSETVQDSFYIYIKIPKGYEDNPGKTYPAIFLLDGDIAFPMSWSIVRYLQYGKYVPDVFVIGIGYGGLLSSNTINKRERDYSISSIEGLKDSGGGEKFLEFLKSELLPLMSTKYRLDNTQFTFSGHSLGASFVLHTLFSEPELFSNYISSSPYLFYAQEKLLSLEAKNMDRIKDSDCKLFISLGANEEQKEYFQPINKIVTQLKQRDSSYLKMNFKVFEQGVHFSTPAEALTYGLIFCFE